MLNQLSVFLEVDKYKKSLIDEILNFHNALKHQGPILECNEFRHCDFDLN